MEKNGLSKIPKGPLPTKKWLTFHSVFKAELGQFINSAVLLYIYLACMITTTATHLGSFLSKNGTIFFNTAVLTTEANLK